MDMNSFFRRMFGFENPSTFDNFYKDSESYEHSQNDPFSSMQSFIHDQLDEILGQFNLDSQFSNDDSILPTDRTSLREQFLKSGFQDTCQAKPNADIDLDDRAIKGNLQSLLDDKTSKNLSTRQGTFISKSYITRTVRQPDGTYVTEKITRDQDGNEEKTVTVHKDNENTPNKGPFGILF